MKKRDRDALILQYAPYFIAENYQRLLSAKTSREQVYAVIHLFGLILRFLTICLVSQYLVKDRDKIEDTPLTELLSKKFSRLTLYDWRELFFAILQVYEEHRGITKSCGLVNEKKTAYPPR